MSRMVSVEMRNGFVVEKVSARAGCGGGSGARSIGEDSSRLCVWPSGRGHWLCHRDIGVSCLLVPAVPAPALAGTGSAKDPRINQGPANLGPGTGGHWPLRFPSYGAGRSGSKPYVAAGCRTSPGLKYRRSDIPTEPVPASLPSPPHAEIEGGTWRCSRLGPLSTR